MILTIDGKKIPFADYVEKVIFPNLTDDYKNKCLEKDGLNSPETYTGFIIDNLTKV